MEYANANANVHVIGQFYESRPGEVVIIMTQERCCGEFVSGSITDEQRNNVPRNSCPGGGACGGMYTANTMASAIETMGMSLPYSSSTPAEDPLKLEECHLAGKYLLDLLKMDFKPRDIITEMSLRNAMLIVMPLGGSTNAVLHLIAIARRSVIKFLSLRTSSPVVNMLWRIYTRLVGDLQ